MAENGLVARKVELSKAIVETLIALLDQIVGFRDVDKMVADLWTRVVVPVYAFLTVPNIRDWMNGNVQVGMPAMGHSSHVSVYLLCRLTLSVWNRQMGRLKSGGEIACKAPNIPVCVSESPSIEKRAERDLSVFIAGNERKPKKMHPQPVSLHARTALPDQR